MIRILIVIARHRDLLVGEHALKPDGRVESLSTRSERSASDFQRAQAVTRSQSGRTAGRPGRLRIRRMNGTTRRSCHGLRLMSCSGNGTHWDRSAPAWMHMRTGAGGAPSTLTSIMRCGRSDYVRGLP